MTQTQTAEIQKYVTSLAYPCSKEELAVHARQSGARPDVVRAIQELPYDYFTTPYAVHDAMKQ